MRFAKWGRAAAAIPTMITGLVLIDTLTLTPDAAALGEIHESLGIMTTMVAVLAAVVRVAGKNTLAGLWGYVYGVAILGSLVLVSLTGHYGGMLAFGRDYLSGLF